MAIPYETLRTNFHCQLPFKRPVLEFTTVPSRFFSMIFDCLDGKIPVNAAEFSAARAGISLSEVHWKYNVYGGPASVTLHLDRLAFDFPILAPSDIHVVRQILEAVHDSFPMAFPELYYERVEIQAFEHLDVAQETSVAELLSPYEMKSVPVVFGARRVIQRPAAKFELVSEDPSWQCTCSVERSLLKSTAVFVALTISLRQLTPQVPYKEKAALVQTVADSCLAVLGLENQVAA
jgi:hypothetical protein